MTAPQQILVVDDDPDFVDSAKRLLEGCGYLVLAARSGREAAALFDREEAPSLIVLDLRMPGMSGRELLEVKQTIPGGAAIPVVILSGSDEGERDDALARLGVVEWLVKPVEPDELLSALERNLGRQGDAPAAPAAPKPARRRIQGREELLATVAHDLRVPLGAITMAASGLLGRDRLEDRDRSSAELILRNARRLERLIRDLVDHSNIESGKLRIEVSRQPVSGVLMQAAETLRGQAEEKGVELRLDRDLPEVEAFCDRDRVVQAVSNLLDNAIKFTPAGGDVSLGLTREHGRARVEVRDTGPGIDPADQQGLFLAYRRDRDAGRSQSGGLGLGLYITRGLIEAQGGVTGVDSAPGRGSTFWFTLPAPIQGSPRPEQSEAAVFLVDDDAAFRREVSELLEDWGYRVASAADGQEALDYLRAHPPPALILLDLMVPVVDGWELFTAIKTDPRLAGVPTVVVSSLREAQLQPSLLEVQGFLEKPINLADLYAVAERYAISNKRRPGS